MTVLDNASVLGRCAVGVSRLPTFTQDQATRRLLARAMLVAAPCETAAHASLPTLDYTASGDASDESVGYAAADDNQFSSIVNVTEVANDLLKNLTPNSVGMDQLLGIVTAMLHAIATNFWAETPSAEAPPGAASYSTSNFMDPTSPDGLLRLDDLECLRDLTKPWNPTTPLMYVAHSDTVNSLKRLARAVGAPLEYASHPDFGDAPVLCYEGTPVLPCDYVSLAETDQTTSVYCLRYGPDRGADALPKAVDYFSFIQPANQRGFSVAGGVSAPSADSTMFTVSIRLGTRSGPTSVARLKGLTPAT